MAKDMNGTFDQEITVECASVSAENALEVQPTPVRKGRSRKQKEECKRLRNYGMSYKREQGKIVKERKMGELTPCRLKCNERFHNSNREVIFNEYWSLGSRDRRALYLTSLITVVGKKTQRVHVVPEDGKCRKYSCKYEIVIDGERRPICKGCFRSTFGETNAFINNIIEQKSSVSSGVIPVDGRGKNSPKTKIPVETLESVRQHVNHKFLISGHTHIECDVDHSVIERTKKKTSMKINHPNDWAQLIRVCKNKNPFNVVTMKREDFLQFSSLLKGNGPFTLKKLNEKKEKFLWRDVQWLRYTQESGHVFYKNTLDESAEFNVINIHRRGKKSAKLVVPAIHDGPVPISAEKKKDLLQLLPLVDTVFHDFYKNLPTANIPCTDPDLQEIDPDEQ